MTRKMETFRVRAANPGETTNLFFSEPAKRRELQALLKQLTAGDNGRSGPKNRKPMGINVFAQPRQQGS